MNTIKETILIVEDDLGLNELISERIQHAGFDTFAVSSAGEAFDWLKAHNPLMMLLDYSLPDMTGKELLENLNAEGLDLPPFVVATGQGDERIAVEMMKLGAKDYILKDRNFLEMIPLVIIKTTEAVETEQILLRTELALKESYRFNQQIIEGAQEGIVVFDINMRYKVFNPYMEKITGVSAAEVIGKHPSYIFPFLKDSGVIDLIEGALRGEIFDEVDVHFDIPKTGKSGWTSDKTAPLFNHLGEIIGVITTVHDITERKAAEKALFESQERFRLAIQATQDGIWEWNLVTNKSFYSPRWCEILGYSFDDPELPHTFQSWADRIHPDDYERVINALNNHIDKGTEYNVEYRHLHKSGEYRWQNSTSTSVLGEDGKIVKIVGCISDITVRKQSEVALSESEANLSEAILIANLGFWKYDVDNDMFTFNDQFYKLYHTTAEEEGGYLMSSANYIQNFVHPDDMHVVADEVQKALQTNDPNYSSLVDHRIICTDGQHKYITVSIRIVKDGKDRTISVKGINQDITERKQAEENLRLSEVKFRNIFENSIVGKSITTLDGKVYVNKAFSDIVGYALDELSEMNWPEFTYREDIEYNAREINSLLKGEKYFSQWEKRYIHKNGSIVWVHISIVLLRDNEGNPIHFISEIYNITERKLAEQALLENMNELLDFQRLTVGRELTMIELKKEVNELLEKSGHEPKYCIVQ